MEVTLNGEKKVFDDNISVAEMITGLYGTDKGMAVAINNTLIPRNDWSNRSLAHGDDIVIIKAAYGG